MVIWKTDKEKNTFGDLKFFCQNTEYKICADSTTGQNRKRQQTLINISQRTLKTYDLACQIKSLASWNYCNTQYSDDVNFWKKAKSSISLKKIFKLIISC